MPKPRTIDTSFFDDPDIACLSRDERLLLIGMISTCADDEGRLMADAGYLRKRVFGYDDDVSKVDVQCWRDTIVSKCRNVRMYTVEGQSYIWLVNWTEYQPMRYVIASKLPPYAEDCDTSRSNDDDFGKLPQSSVNSPRVGLSRVKEQYSSVAGKPRAKAARPLPDDFSITDTMRLWAKKNVPGLDILAATEEWKDAMRSNTTKYKYTDWEAAWHNGMKRAQQWGGNNGNGTNRQSAQEISPEERVQQFRPGFRELLEKRISGSGGS
jgi:hypothetical protein